LSISGMALIAALGGSFSVFAEEAVEPTLAESEAVQDEAAVAQQNEVVPPPQMFGAVAVDEALLDTNRGGADTEVLNDIRASGTVQNNEAHHLRTGNNIITDGSFAGASGFSSVLQNSGNNVLIQNSTIVNVQVQ
jgi:hypothetical protein